MSINQLSTEILQKIFESATVKDAIHLAQTSKKNYRAFLGRRLHILELATYNSYSPLPELLKLVIANEPDKSRKPLSTELRRNATLNQVIQTQTVPRLTLELIIKMVQYGKVAERWAEVYPRIFWRHDSSNRRFLRSHELERFRTAVYRYWMYATLFHDQLFVQHDPDRPQFSSDPRLRLLRTYSTTGLLQLTEFNDKMQEMIQLDLFPSNAMVRSQYLYPVSAKALASLGWGEDEPHMCLVMDLMKLPPDDLLHLYEHTTTKAQRLEFVFAKGRQFMDAPATLRDSIAMVHDQRKTGVGISTSIFDDATFGIVDHPECPAFTERETHPWANDASPTGDVPRVEREMDDDDDDEEDEDDEEEDSDSDL